MRVGPKHAELPTGVDSFEKLQRKCKKLKEGIELEISERGQVDNVINFFSETGVDNNKFLDEDFYNLGLKQSTTRHQKKPNHSTAFKTHEVQPLDQINQSSIIQQPRQSTYGGIIFAQQNKISRQDMSAYMKTKLSKTKIQSEAESLPVEQKKNFTPPPPVARPYQSITPTIIYKRRLNNKGFSSLSQSSSENGIDITQANSILNRPMQRSNINLDESQIKNTRTTKMSNMTEEHKTINTQKNVYKPCFNLPQKVLVENPVVQKKEGPPKMLRESVSDLQSYSNKKRQSVQPKTEKNTSKQVFSTPLVKNQNSQKLLQNLKNQRPGYQVKKRIQITSVHDLILNRAKQLGDLVDYQQTAKFPSGLLQPEEINNNNQDDEDEESEGFYSMRDSEIEDNEKILQKTMIEVKLNLGSPIKVDNVVETRQKELDSIAVVHPAEDNKLVVSNNKVDQINVVEDSDYVQTTNNKMIVEQRVFTEPDQQQLQIKVQKKPIRQSPQTVNTPFKKIKQISSPRSMINRDSKSSLKIDDLQSPRSLQGIKLPPISRKVVNSTTQVQRFERFKSKLSAKTDQSKISNQNISKPSEMDQISEKVANNNNSMVQQQRRRIAIPKPPVQQDDFIDYSHLYSTFFDIFSGNYSDKFDIPFAIKEARILFATFVNLMDKDQQTNEPQSQLTLRDKQKSLKTKDESQLVKDALNSQTFEQPNLYYRVIKQKTEGQDLITKSLELKTRWGELPHGLDLKSTWNLLWSWSKIESDLQKLLVFQKANHFVGASQMSNIAFLKRNLERAQKFSQKASKEFQLMPVAYVLPKEYVDFLTVFSDLEEEEGSKNLWIMKSALQNSKNQKTSIINDISQITYGEPMILQKFLRNPLLVKGFKFDLRVYVLVTSVNPLEAFLYEEGFAQFSTQPMSDTAADEQISGTKVSIATLKELMETGWDHQSIWSRVKSICLKALVAAQNDMTYNPSCFDLFGMDLVFDDTYRPWLLEITQSPSLACEALIDDMIKQQLIDDTIDLITPVDFDRKRLLEVLERRMHEDVTQAQGGTGQKRMMNRDLTYILRGQMPRGFGETPQLRGGFEMISPSVKCDEYLKIVGGQKMFGSQSKIIGSSKEVRGVGSLVDQPKGQYRRQPTQAK